MSLNVGMGWCQQLKYARPPAQTKQLPDAAVPRRSVSRRLMDDLRTPFRMCDTISQNFYLCVALNEHSTFKFYELQIQLKFSSLFECNQIYS